MFNPWAYSILVLALVALVASWTLPRARLWIAIGMTSFLASSLQWDFGDREFHPIFTLACDALVCLALHIGGREKWELGVFAAFLVSVFCSLLRLGGFIPNGILYASLLELCNYCALLWIGGMGTMERFSKNEGALFYPVRRDLRSAYRSVHR
jgi:hypothetical protein